MLWKEGICTFDVSRKDNFQLRAALMWTINDFAAYSMLSGWSTAGRMLSLTAWTIHKPSTLRIARRFVGLTVIEGF